MAFAKGHEWRVNVVTLDWERAEGRFAKGGAYTTPTLGALVGHGQ